MSDQGWEIKTINQTYQGVSDSNSTYDSGFGYGLSIPDGYMIIWERK